MVSPHWFFCFEAKNMFPQHEIQISEKVLGLKLLQRCLLWVLELC